MRNFFKRNRFIIILLAITFFLRLPSLFEPYSYGDEGIYLTLGLAIKKGLLLYRDVYDNKPPLIYLLAAAAGAQLFWFRFFLMSSILSSIYLFYRLSQKLFSLRSWAPKATTIVFTLLTTFPLTEGNIANSEIFILLPTLLGFWLVFNLLETKNKKTKPKLKGFFVAGLILSLGFLLKVPAVFDFLALLGYLFFFYQPKKLFNFEKKSLFLISGYGLPIVFTGLYFWARGALAEFFDSCFRQTFGYLSSWETGSGASSIFSLLRTDMSYRGIMLLFSLALLWWKRKSLEKSLLFVSLWFVFSLFGATLSGRPYPHYLIQLTPALALGIGFFSLKKRKVAIVSFSLLIFLLGVALARYRFWFYATTPYYQNFIQFVIGKKSKEEYFRHFNGQMNQIYRLAEFIGASTKENERVFVWGNEPYLYPLSKRLPATPNTVAYHIMERHQYQETAQELREQKPPLVVVDQSLETFSELQELLFQDYQEFEDFDGLRVFLRKNHQ